MTSGEEFDRLAQAAQSGTMEANNALWGAVLALDSWWLLPDGDPPQPRVGVLDGRPFVLAFTSSERARQQAVAWGLAGPDSVQVMSTSPQGIVESAPQLQANGVFGIAFDHGLSGFFAPLDNLPAIAAHVGALAPDEEPLGGWYATYEGQERRAEPLGDGALVGLLGAAQPVPTQQLSELYAINLIATDPGSGEPCAIVSRVGDRLRLWTTEPGPGSTVDWQPVERGGYESLVPADQLETSGLRTDLPLTPPGPPLILQKVLTPEQTRAVRRGRLRHVSGYVSRLEDVLALRTPDQVVSHLIPDYPGSPFSAADESVCVLRFALRDGTWRLTETDDGPPTQFLLGPRQVMPMPVDAELQVLSRDGGQRVLMRYGGLEAGWRDA